LANNPDIIDLLQAEIDEVNKTLASFETIKKFKIIPIELDTNNYLTPSLKIKKKKILTDYSNLVQSMYK
jgi:long-chain acyl-CoA synthetase